VWVAARGVVERFLANTGVEACEGVERLPKNTGNAVLRYPLWDRQLQLSASEIINILM